MRGGDSAEEPAHLLLPVAALLLTGHPGQLHLRSLVRLVTTASLCSLFVSPSVDEAAPAPASESPFAPL